MKRLILLISITLLMTGCAVYPGYYGYYDSGSYGYPYGYTGTSVNLNLHGGHYGHHGRHYGHHGGHGHGGHGHGWHR